MKNLKYFLCGLFTRHRDTREVITYVNDKDAKHVDTTCNMCDKVVKREGFLRRQWGYESVSEEFK